MTSRELFHAIMHYEHFDRMPVWHWCGWPQTEERWERENGLKRDSDHCAFFNAEPIPSGVGVPWNAGLFPAFDEEVFEETDDYRVIRQADGVVAKHWKKRSCIPQHTEFLFCDRADWPEYKKRLQPDPARLPENLDEHLENLRNGSLPCSMFTGIYVGFTRNWMGVENFCMACRLDPDLLAEVADTMADLVCWMLDHVLPKLKIDLGWSWEDICFRSGPLVPPEVFRDVAVPAYKKVTNKLHEHGVDLCAVDCDGVIDSLVPHWLDAGVNIVFPVEIGAWHADPMALRERHGRELRIIGGINKYVLEQDQPAIDAEIERRLPLMRDGGFIPLPDHLITPDTPLENYQYYLERIRGLRFQDRQP